MRRTLPLLLLVAAVVVYAASRPGSKHHAAPRATAAGHSAAFAKATRATGCHIRGPLPDPACTPGAIFTTAKAADICRRGYAGSVRDVPQALKERVYLAYGIRSRSRGQYEVDHLVSLELGGSNDQANLFPEAADPRPGFHEKDRLENRLHDDICSGAIALRTAQHGIASDWLKLYRRDFGGG